MTLLLTKDEIAATVDRLACALSHDYQAWRRVYVGHDIAPAFVYGYGMDLDGRARQREAVHVMKDSQ